jgi:hypothetical protein
MRRIKAASNLFFWNSHLGRVVETRGPANLSANSLLSS